MEATVAFLELGIIAVNLVQFVVYWKVIIIISFVSVAFNVQLVSHTHTSRVLDSTCGCVPQRTKCRIALHLLTRVFDGLKATFLLVFTCYTALLCLSCRYTSAHTLETNRTSATIPAVGRSLQQVFVGDKTFTQNFLLSL